MPLLPEWLPAWAAVLVAFTTIVAAVYGGMVTVNRLSKRRIRGVVKAMLDLAIQDVDSRLLALQIGVGEITYKIGQLEDDVSNGLTDDVAYLRERIDRIYDHLID